MIVNYNPKLVELIKEVHQLQLLEYKIPSIIKHIADKANAFIQQAKALELVSIFLFSHDIPIKKFIQNFCIL